MAGQGPRPTEPGPRAAPRRLWREATGERAGAWGPAALAVLAVGALAQAQELADLSATDLLSPGSLLASSSEPDSGGLPVSLTVPGPPGEGVPLQLAVTVNGRPTDLVAAFTLDPASGRLSSPRSELLAVGIDPGLRRGSVPLDAIPGVAYRYDAAAQAVEIAVEGRALEPRVVSAHRTPEPLPADPGWGAVLNYGASVGLDGDVIRPSDWEGPVPFDRLTLGTDAWIYSPLGVLSTTAVLGLDADGGGDALRYETRFERTLPRRAVTLALGDVVSGSMAWGRSVRLAGVQVRRDWSLRPDLVTEPLLSFSGAAAVPSAVDVFIDNARVWSGRVEGGAWRLEDVPLAGGAGAATVVVTDETGEVSTREVPFFASRSLLKGGRADFSFEGGLAREAYGIASADYGEAALGSASLRYGLTDRVTVEAHAEGTEGLSLVSAGVSAVLLDRVEVGFSTGSSRHEGAPASFTYGTMRTRLWGLSVEGSSLRAGEDFADLAYATALDGLGGESLDEGSLLAFPTALDLVSVSWSPRGGFGSVGLSAVRSERAGARDELYALTWGQNLDWAEASVNVSGAWDAVDEAARASLLVSIPFGRGGTHATLARDRERGTVAGLSLRRPLGEAAGDWGWEAGWEHDERADIVTAAAEMRAAWGRGEVAARADGDRTVASARWDGAVVLAGGRLAAGGTVTDGFAVVDVGVPGIPVSLQNREVAVTGPGGRALVPGLVSHAGNRISVDVADLPLDATVAVTAAEVVPGRRAGVVVDLSGAGGAAGGGSALVVLRDAAGAVLPAGARARVEGGPETFVGYDGQAFVTGLVPGRAVALTVSLPGGSCAATVTLPPGAGLQPRIEETCR